MRDRRRWPRYTVPWLARVSLQDGGAIMSRTIKASLHGLLLDIESDGAPTPLRRGERYRIELHDSAREWTFVRTGEVRHLDDQAAGFQITEPLPQFLLDRGSAAESDAASGPADVRRPGPRVFEMARDLLRGRLHVMV